MPIAILKMLMPRASSQALSRIALTSSVSCISYAAMSVYGMWSFDSWPTPWRMAAMASVLICGSMSSRVIMPVPSAPAFCAPMTWKNFAGSDTWIEYVPLPISVVAMCHTGLPVVMSVSQ